MSIGNIADDRDVIDTVPRTIVRERSVQACPRECGLVKHGRCPRGGFGQQGGDGCGTRFPGRTRQAQRAGQPVLRGHDVVPRRRGEILPSYRERICQVPVWIHEEGRKRRTSTYTLEEFVRTRTKYVWVRTDCFDTLAWLLKVGVDLGAKAPWQRLRLVEVIALRPAPVRPCAGEPSNGGPPACPWIDATVPATHRGAGQHPCGR